MKKKENMFEYEEREVSTKKESIYEPIKSEPALSSWFWVIIAIFVILVLVNVFWDYIVSIGPSAFFSVGILVMFIILNILSALKRKKKKI